MLALFASLKTARFWLKSAPWIAVILGALAFVMWVRGMQHSITDLTDKNASLSSALASETQARKADVAGLTSLSTGLLAASSAKTADQTALSETIDATHPTPVSAGLRDLLGCLREADNGRVCAATARTGSSAPSAAGSAH